MADGNTFQLIDIGSEYAFEFQFFPESISIQDGANWVPQDTTIGVKPLFYANGEPTVISVSDLILDNTDNGVSLKPDLDLLRLFKTELEEGGPPPALLAVWGDQEERCVLVDLNIEQIFFNDNGECIRAKIGLELLQLQDDGEATDVTVVEEPEPEEPEEPV